MAGHAESFRRVQRQPGCDITSSTAFAAELNCGTSTFASGTPLGEQGLTIGSDNPYNDYTNQQSPIGSGNGATQELHQGQQGIPSAQYFRASAPKGDATVNRVAYAIDGQSWIGFKEIGTVLTPHYNVKDISLAQLNSIYADTLSCTVSGVTYHEDWICLGAHTAAHIDCYDAQTGSGTYATWTGSTNVPSAAYTQGTSVPACANDELAGHGTAASHVNIPENQMASIYTSANNDAANALYYFSYGKYTQVCREEQMPGHPGIGYDPRYIRRDQRPGVGYADDRQQLRRSTARTCQRSGRSSGTCTTTTTTRRSTTPASQATLNFTSELGWLCKASTASETDPNTGGTERATIDAAIIRAASCRSSRMALHCSVRHRLERWIVPVPGTLTDPGYVANDGSNGATTGSYGFCLVTIG